MRKIISTVLLITLAVTYSRSQDAESIKTLFDETLKDGQSFEMLQYLTKSIGPRLSGSPGAAQAVTWCRDKMKELEFDSVWLQSVMVPHWVRGQQEVGNVIFSKRQDVLPLAVCALGGSIGTGPQGLKAGVVEVKALAELEKLGAKKELQGKIVFFNRPMDPTLLNTFDGYRGAVDQRANGASQAAKYGAIGVVVRSMGDNPEDYPHTGQMIYAPDINKIPALAISTRHADQLSKWLKEDPQLLFYMESHCELLPDVESYNVIGQIKGSKFPEEIIMVGGHLDSWDLAEGAHDDGAGCVHSIEALRLLRRIGYKPQRTLRAVMFMNEENGLRGGAKYGQLAIANKERHLAAIESDRGGFTPRGFTMTGSIAAKNKIKSWRPLLEPYGLADFGQEGSGADIGPLANPATTLIGFLPDSQRYFDYHHTPVDTFDKVSRRELELGSASIAALMLLIDKYGLE